MKINILIENKFILFFSEISLEIFFFRIKYTYLLEFYFYQIVL